MRDVVGFLAWILSYGEAETGILRGAEKGCSFAEIVAGCETYSPHPGKWMKVHAQSIAPGQIRRGLGNQVPGVPGN